ncbi:hypothetical protein IAT38_000947 [Cryptococcus sp. DSM 104549]
MTTTSPTLKRASRRSDDFDLPLYHKHDSSSSSPHHPPTPPPEAPDTPGIGSSTSSIPEPDALSSPEALLPLFPVHHLILRYLADLAPTKALTLSRYTYDFLSPSVYRHATANKSLLRGLELKWGYERKLKALKHVERLTLKDKEGAWAVGMLSHSLNEPRQYEGVFSGVKVLATTREVRERGYHESRGMINRRVEYEEVLWRIETQLGNEWEDEKLWEEEGWGPRSAYFEIGETASHNSFPVPPIPQNIPPPSTSKSWWRDKIKPWLSHGLGIFLYGVILSLPLQFHLLASLATVPIHRYSIATLTSNWVVETGPEGNVTVPVKVNFGVASGCIWYNHTGPMCSMGLPWIPDPELLHLPSNQTLTSLIPIAAARGLLMLHVVTGLEAITVAWSCYVWLATEREFDKVCGVPAVWLAV